MGLFHDILGPFYDLLGLINVKYVELNGTMAIGTCLGPFYDILRPFYELLGPSRTDWCCTCWNEQGTNSYLWKKKVN